jgi:SAM-dependent methyltransferase
VSEASGNLDRFSGFADLYDAHRPSAPARLGPLLRAYAGVARPDVVDLGSGTGLSTRWAAAWAASVVGVEPNPDMRAQADARPTAGVRYVEGISNATGLADASADVVLAVQAMHWMEPESTLAEVARLLRPGGVFAAVDADWPPMTGSTAAEQAWAALHARVRVLEARLSRGESGDALRAPIGLDDPALADDDLADPHRNRAMPGGVRSWSKGEHLARIRASGRFAFTREVVFDEPVVLPDGETVADRFVALKRSQGSYQGLCRAGLSDDEIGMTVFERDARAALGATRASEGLGFCWRVRLGVAPR